MPKTESHQMQQLTEWEKKWQWLKSCRITCKHLNILVQCIRYYFSGACSFDEFCWCRLKVMCAQTEYSHANAKLIKTNKRNLHFSDLLVDSQLFVFFITTINHINQLKCNSKSNFSYDKSIHIEIDGFSIVPDTNCMHFGFVCGVIIRCIRNGFDCIDWFLSR